MPVASVREIEIYYEIYGLGPRVLLISGTGETVARNRDRYQGPLVEQFEVLMYDQRGLGQTSHPDVEYSMADYADDAAGLLRSVGWSRCHVVGVSFGGMVAQHLAIRHPELVDRLVLACTTSGGQGGSSYDLLQLESMSPTERILKLLPVLDSRNDPTAQPPRWAPGLESFFASAGSPLPDDPVQLAGFRRQLEARARHDAWGQLPGIKAPTLVIGGTYDRQAPPENLERLAGRVPGAQLTFCDGGHLFLWQDPDAWLDVTSFLSG